KWAKKLNISDYQFVVPQPHPATPFYSWLKSKNYLSENGEPNYPNLSINDLQYWRFYAYRHIYLSPKYLLTSLLRSVKEPKELVRLVKIGIKGLPNIFRKK
ncbi:MAG: hypothetical protein Q8N88_02715, partial [Nanoarchaeota archaeon]|nr:hypothetical protein [Nanoarchaeota archaeon]